MTSTHTTDIKIFGDRRVLDNTDPVHRALISAAERLNDTEREISNATVKLSRRCANIARDLEQDLHLNPADAPGQEARDLESLMKIREERINQVKSFARIARIEL